MEWAYDCHCNPGKPSFESIEFNTTNSRIEIVCGKCHGAICWWPISTEQIVPVAAGRIKKLSAVQVELD